MIEWLAGILFGLMIHEAAHEVVARASGGQTRWQGITFTYQGPNRKGVAIAGLAAQAISSEILLTRDYQTNFTKGWLTYNVGNTVNYIIKNEVRNGYGDLGNFTRNEARNIEAVLLVHTYSVAHRMRWQFFPTKNGIMIRKEL